jgi:hypothetical protein
MSAKTFLSAFAQADSQDDEQQLWDKILGFLFYSNGCVERPPGNSLSIYISIKNILLFIICIIILFCLSDETATVSILRCMLAIAIHGLRVDGDGEFTDVQFAEETAWDMDECPPNKKYKPSSGNRDKMFLLKNDRYYCMDRLRLSKFSLYNPLQISHL